MTIPEALHLLEVGAHSHDSVTSRLAVLHAQIRRLVPAVDRISCALHEPEDGLLKTFVHSTTSAQPLQAYQFRLADSASLSALVRERGERVIDDMQVELHGHGHAHTEWLLAQGYRSSYTLPLFDHENLIGLLFFDALTPSAFQPLVCERLRPYASLIAMLLSQELSTMRMLVGSIQIAREFANLRDIETGSHLMRMAAFAQLVMPARDRAFVAVGVVPVADLVDVLADRERGARRDAHRARAVGRREARAALRQRIQVRRLHDRVPVAAEHLRGMLVGHDDKDVARALGHVRPRCRSECRGEGAGAGDGVRACR